MVVGAAWILSEELENCVVLACGLEVSILIFWTVGWVGAIKVLLHRFSWLCVSRLYDPGCFLVSSHLAMVHPAFVSAFVLLVSAACAKPLSTTHTASKRDMVVHERRDSVPSGFVHVAAAPEDEVLNLRFALTQGNFSGLESELYAISTPGSERYRQFLSKEEVCLSYLTICTVLCIDQHAYAFVIGILGRSLRRTIRRYPIHLQRLARLQ